MTKYENVVMHMTARDICCSIVCVHDPHVTPPIDRHLLRGTCIGTESRQFAPDLGLIVPLHVPPEQVPLWRRARLCLTELPVRLHGWDHDARHPGGLGRGGRHELGVRENDEFSIKITHKTRSCVSKTRIFALKTRGFALKMMNFADRVTSSFSRQMRR